MIVIEVDISSSELNTQRRLESTHSCQINSVDMVLIRKQNAKMAGKLQPKWLGPYLATQTTRAGAYILQDSEGNQLPHTWNIDDLRKYYP